LAVDEAAVFAVCANGKCTGVCDSGATINVAQQHEHAKNTKGRRRAKAAPALFGTLKSGVRSQNKPIDQPNSDF